MKKFLGWFGSASDVWAVGALGMHWGIYFIMGITFKYPLYGIAFLAFFDLEKIGGLVRRGTRARRSVETPEPELEPEPEPVVG